MDDEDVPGKRWIRTSATASFGNSGGGAFDEFCRLVGITSERRSDAGGSITYAPADRGRRLGQRTGPGTGASDRRQYDHDDGAHHHDGCADDHTVAPTITTRSVVPAAGTYTVVLGDTLEGIARAFNTSVDALRAANGSAADRLVDRQRLLLPQGARPLTPGDVATVDYLVVAGDTIIDVARRLGVTPAELLTINGKLAAPDDLAVGERLLVPQFG